MTAKIGDTIEHIELDDVQFVAEWPYQVDLANALIAQGTWRVKPEATDGEAS